MKPDFDSLKLLANTIRMLSADAVQKAESGHPGMPMGAADYAAVLWAYHLRINPKDPSWHNRDRFVLSAGHGSMLLYSLLNLFGYDLPLDELKNFRQWGSKTPGHPEFGLTAGVECTTGPLGQGVGNGIGMALSGKMLQARYSKELFNYRVFGICSDGDLMEGVASEAASLAGHLKLGNLVYIYDDNHISIGGSTEVSFTENVQERFKSYGWHVQAVDGHDMLAVHNAINEAVKVTDQPSLIAARTTIGLGSPNKAGTSGVHGEPLGKEELALTKKKLNWPETPFHIPEEVAKLCCAVLEPKLQEYNSWQDQFLSWSKSNAALAKQYHDQTQKVIPADLQAKLEAEFDPKKATKAATRNLSGQAIQVLAANLPGFIGGSADLEPSTKTLIKGSADVQAGNFVGKNLRFGVREHGMGSITNGLAYCGGWFPYTATFLVFSDYMRPTLRLAALSHLQTLFIFTHDSIFVGEDGPTHQPIEHLQSMRLIPNLYIFRPADGLETGMSYLAALHLKHSPSCLIFTRQNLPPVERPASFKPEHIMKGAYLVSGEDATDVAIVATGSEVWVAVESAKILAKEGISARVVSMPCMELFLKQDEGYRKSVLPDRIKKVSIEAGSTRGWEVVTGAAGLNIGIDRYGASAPGELVAQKYGIVPDSVCERVRKFVKG